MSSISSRREGNSILACSAAAFTFCSEARTTPCSCDAHRASLKACLSGKSSISSVISSIKKSRQLSCFVWWNCAVVLMISSPTFLQQPKSPNTHSPSPPTKILSPLTPFTEEWSKSGNTHERVDENTRHHRLS